MAAEYLENRSQVVLTTFSPSGAQICTLIEKKSMLTFYIICLLFYTRETKSHRFGMRHEVE